MSDDKSKTGGRDRQQISLEQDYEVHDWSKAFGCTEAELRTAVQTVGNSADNVREFLKKK